ncbi:MAG: amidohydrolase family protein [Chloroflexi bacterium]|nr:amidohydrolase family protein [Chloroflexota bacterium]MBV9600516.1 amidohydrolase family protein [Chloroflexota bacterium]
MATIVRGSRSADIHRQLDHPVVDGDAHWLESVPVFHDYLKATGGQSMLDEYVKTQDGADRWFQTPAEERFRQRMGRPNYWFGPGNTVDRATSMIPRLMYERLPDFGIDFAVVYPTMGLGGFQGANRVQGAGLTSDLRRCCVRAYNIMAADMFRAYADRMTPAAIIPTVTPQEGVEEAEYAVNTLGLKVGMLHGVIQRPIPADEDWQPDPRRRRHYFDNLALDSPYDYDPLWAKMVELGLAYTSHSGSSSDTATRTSPSSVVQSRVGHFAQAHQIALKGLLLGGVPHRFPTLNFAFLEAGIAWAVNVCIDLMLIFTKFGREGLERDLHPHNLDPRQLRELFDEYATDEQFRGRIDRVFDENNLWPNQPGKTAEDLIVRAADWDEFAAAHITRPEQIRELFMHQFYFGCESDDPTVRWAFDEHSSMGTRFKPIFSSDISHFDVTDMTEVLEEAWELVEHELVDEQGFRELTFTNPVTLHGRMNPDFFKGTVVEAEAERELASPAVGV